jgi:hypothetical protein
MLDLHFAFVHWSSQSHQHLAGVRLLIMYIGAVQSIVFGARSWSWIDWRALKTVWEALVNQQDRMAELRVGLPRNAAMAASHFPADVVSS